MGCIKAGASLVCVELVNVLGRILVRYKREKLRCFPSHESKCALREGRRHDQSCLHFEWQAGMNGGWQSAPRTMSQGEDRSSSKPHSADTSNLYNSIRVRIARQMARIGVQLTALAILPQTGSPYVQQVLSV